MRFFIPLFIFLSFFVQASNSIEFKLDSLDKTLLLAHPSESNIKIIHTLHHQGLMDLSEFNLIGIHHGQEIYDYEKSQSIIDTISSLSFHLVEINDSLFADSLYCKNRLSHHFKDLFDNSIGIIFFGGPDIPPAIYKEETHSRTVITDPYRHYFEASFIFHLIGGYQDNSFIPLIESNPDYLVNGICLGMQTMNIASGGTLIQDIPLEIYNSEEVKGLQHLEQEEVHRNYHRFSSPEYKNQLSGSSFHSIRFKDFFFPDLLEMDSNLTPSVNSYHHQAVEKLGKGFRVCAVSNDNKVIEAMFHCSYPNVFAVQFHPERTGYYLEEDKYQFEPNGKRKYLSEWIDEESMDFHIRYWKAIDKILNEKL